MKGSQAVARIIFQQRYEKSTKEREAKKFSKLLASIITDEDDESASHTTPLSNIRVATSTLHRKYWTCWITKSCASDVTDPWVLKILKGLLIVNSIAGNIEESKWKNNIAEPTHIWGEEINELLQRKILPYYWQELRVAWKRMGKRRSSWLVFSEQGIPIKITEESNRMELKKRGLLWT